jgi:4-amino-4-deoxy-L-arabinose transferase-like glycosyltransferase
VSPKLQAALLALLAICLSGWFAVSIPQDSPNLRPSFRGLNPDENDHVSYARKLKESGGLIRFPADEIRKARESGGDGKEFADFAEAHQPPLYYAVGAALGGGLMTLRWLSVLLGAATVVMAYFAARDLFRARPEVAWGAAGILATLPAFAHLSGAANNDTLTTLISAGVFWRLGRLVRDGASVRDALVLGIWLGVGLWTKLTVLQLFPLVGLAFLLAPKEKGWLGRAALAFGTALVMASPWLIRNALLYGDPFNLKIFPLTAPVGTPTPQSMQAIPQLGLTSGSYFGLVAERSFATFFYLMPPNGPLWPKTGPLALLAALSIIGLLGAVKVARGAKRNEGRVLWLFAAAPLFLVPFFASFNLRFFQAQGRYFHPTLFPVACLLAVGISTLAGEKWAGKALGAVCLLLGVLSALQATSLCQAL